MIQEKGVRITIARKTMPSLRATAMRDFFNWVKKLGIYKEEWHNKSENIFRYPYSGSEIDFLSVDEPTRVRSRRREYLLLNEGNEFAKEDYMQLSMRTEKQIFIDYNPSNQYHWIYDDLQPREDCVIIRSTYLDNPFLPREIVKEIEGYKKQDQNYWRIYGLGLKGLAESLIYTHWQLCDDLPKDYDKKIFGLDFGYNNHTALVEVREKDKEFFWREHLYQRYLTNQDLILKLKELVLAGKLTYKDIIYCDNAEPDRIEEISSAGFNAVACIKLKVKDRIDIVKSHAFHITKDSPNLQKEAKMYSWRMKDDQQLEEPVKNNDHLLDGGGYAISSERALALDPFPDQNILETPFDEKAKPSSAGFIDMEF